MIAKYSGTANQAMVEIPLRSSENCEPTVQKQLIEHGQQEQLHMHTADSHSAQLKTYSAPFTACLPTLSLPMPGCYSTGGKTGGPSVKILSALLHSLLA